MWVFVRCDVNGVEQMRLHERVIRGLVFRWQPNVLIEIERADGRKFQLLLAMNAYHLVIQPYSRAAGDQSKNGIRTCPDEHGEYSGRQLIPGTLVGLNDDFHRCRRQCSGCSSC